MSVKTNGQQVSIQFKAQDERSKKIIEDSLGSLKDNLALQSLSLGKDDVGFTAKSNCTRLQQYGFKPRITTDELECSRQSGKEK